MTTLTKIRAWFKHRKPKADDNIERSEPEFILANTQDYIFGLIIAALWMMIAYAFMTDQATDWIARMLLLIDGTFEERLATLTSVFVLFSDMLVIIAIAMNREASTGDIVDVVNDLGEQLDERFAELEQHITQETGAVLKEVQDSTFTPQS